jgi:mRNA interferase RelE/StbE
VKTRFRQSFLDDVNSVSEKGLRRRAKEAMLRVERATSLRDVPNLKKLQGHRNHYRIRVGSYRIGISLHEDTVVFVRFLPRRDIYRYFP